MKRLTDTQKTAIQNLRVSGLGYKTIAEKLSLSRDTVRSYCVRNHIPANGTTENQDTHNTADAVFHSENGKSEIKAGNTVFIITTEYSRKASETLEKKLEKLILEAASKAS